MAEATTATQPNKLWLALDVVNLEQAQRLRKRLGRYIGGVKLGPQLMLMNDWRPVAASAKDDGLEVCADIKGLETPDTLQSMLAQIIQPHDVDYATVHCRTGLDALRRLQGQVEDSCVKLLGVTVLSNETSEELRYYGGRTKFANYLGDVAIDAGLAGIVISGHQLPQMAVNAHRAGQLVAAVGIRPLGSSADNHAEALPPAMALGYGADRLIVGRPIVVQPSAAEQLQAALSIDHELHLKQYELNNRRPIS